jgi:hypothetical protein
MRKVCLVVSFFAAVTLTLGPAVALAGNGVGQIASNKVYGVNIIGYTKCPKGDDAQRIAVLGSFIDPTLTPGGSFDTTTFTLDKTNKIYIVPGPDFEVLDSNACDSTGAALQLPPNAPTDYNVFVRLVGGPGGWIQIFSCATLASDPTTIACGTGITKTRLTGKGEPSFTNVTNQLLKINGTQIFDPSLEDVFWVWNTNNNPHAQVWFVDCTGYTECIQ